MPYRLGKRSLEQLKGVHPDLVAVVRKAIEISPIDFVVLEGRRTRERQRELVDKGASRTMDSRHLTGHAVDLGAIFEGKLTWRTEAYRRLAPWIKEAAQELYIPLQWGGEWTRFPDMPHWQLSRKHYP